jgi:hypothetical protein
MTDRERSVFEKAIYRYGPAAQKDKLLEEMAELTLEILHHRIGRGDIRHIAEELADVRIMLDQAEIIFRCADQAADWRQRKVERLAAKLFEEEYPNVRAD